MISDYSIRIGKREIGYNKPVFIIAEAGVNHNGDRHIAKKLIDVAAKSGADAVKFQTFKAESVVTRTAAKAEYQKSTTPASETQYDMIKKLELSFPVFKELSEYAKKRKILFLSTPFDEESVDFLDLLHVPALKISSGDITNFPLLKKIAYKNKPVILSTGMASLGEVEDSFHFLIKNGAKGIILLHCTSSYPAPYGSVNLHAMNTLRQAFHVPVGYSDHTEGISIPIAATAMGACVIEKHFTLNKNLPGPDHRASLDPLEFHKMVTAIRDVEAALGSGIKKPTKEEEKNKGSVRRSIVSKRDIDASTPICESDLTFKRPGTGIDPKKSSLIIGRKTRTRILKDQLIQWDMLE